MELEVNGMNLQYTSKLKCLLICYTWMDPLLLHHAECCTQSLQVNVLHTMLVVSLSLCH